MGDQSDLNSKQLHIGKPAWLKTPIGRGETYFSIKKDLRDQSLFTVCEEAKCPNIGQCWNFGTATFMIMGDTCTRGCRFCHIKTGDPNGWLDPDEPQKIAQLAESLRLKYAVITMVDRDDLSDGGAHHVASVIKRVKEVSPAIQVEVLAGDFRNIDESIKTVMAAKPEVFAHNLETVERLTPRVRDARAGYKQSLAVLKKIKEFDTSENMFTKSALMLGLGETLEEVFQSLQDLRDSDVDFVTIGQYMRPTKKHLSIKRWVPPAEFDEIADHARTMGFLSVVSGPLVRSSFKAGEFYAEALKKRGLVHSQVSALGPDQISSGLDV
jgi:lipoic acid synthetase